MNVFQFVFSVFLFIFILGAAFSISTNTGLFVIQGIGLGIMICAWVERFQR